ncbi:hypothetical protein N3K66_008172 [Trichothecium roseum]|uniref:Uncharacterized protein n=1 Tax=Trichothecium roseum TaxID=47278 RepID=A0ACC0UTV4_9HYPO|nr:hypothetical protein N3K66_008172 [Trichothecium roseum]
MATDNKPTVCFLGPEASYSHQAVKLAFSEAEWDLRPVTTIDDIFVTVQKGLTTAGVIPFENSTNGSVVFTLDDLADRDGRFPDIQIIGEVYVDVHHCLVGHKSAVNAADDVGSGACTPTASDPSPTKPKSKPLSDLKHIQRLYSHPQAFGQCNNFISHYLKGVEVFDVSSTSKAAEMVSHDETGTWAAISSSLAAQVHGLDLLGKAIEDRDDNTTRFLVIAKSHQVGDIWKPATPPPADLGSKSLVSFTVSHRSPGALARVLGCFRDHDINLTSINSRPSLVQPFQYIFFVELEGHRRKDPEKKVASALEEIDKVADTWRWLGSWERYR